jgi:hypothetical protein
VPNYRLLHANYRTGRKSKQLTELELIVWLAYLESADDYGVCPASPRKLQGDDPWLAKRPARLVQRCVEHLIALGLVQTFTEDGDVYLCQPDWQDYQKIRYPSDTTFPAPPVDVLARFSAKTRALYAERFARNGANISETFTRNGSGDSDLPTAKAKASANASEDLSLTERSSDCTEEAGFEEFWQAYPKKRAKDAALKAWRKLKPDNALRARILLAIDEQKHCTDWLKDGGQFIPYPASWLNAGEWKNEPMDETPHLSEKTTNNLRAIYGTN